MTHRLGRVNAFTLIELLIVVAIIAILAAIAVPNFLEAQTRAKVSRAKSDMRASAVAMEAYHVDWNAYPWPSDPFGRVLTEPTEDWFETKIGPNITTPIAYLTSRFPDLFHPTDDPDEDMVFHLMTRAYAMAQRGTEEPYNAYLTILGQNPNPIRYAMLSHGPDMEHLDADGGIPPVLYDPTNGTVSRGDILYFGPGVGYGN